jgi:hypothetical protein
VLDRGDRELWQKILKLKERRLLAPEGLENEQRGLVLSDVGIPKRPLEEKPLGQ